MIQLERARKVGGKIILGIGGMFEIERIRNSRLSLSQEEVRKRCVTSPSLDTRQI